MAWHSVLVSAHSHGCHGQLSCCTLATRDVAAAGCKAPCAMRYVPRGRRAAMHRTTHRLTVFHFDGRPSITHTRRRLSAACPCTVFIRDLNFLSPALITKPGICVGSRRYAPSARVTYSSRSSPLGGRESRMAVYMLRSVPMQAAAALLVPALPYADVAECSSNRYRAQFRNQQQHHQ